MRQSEKKITITSHKTLQMSIFLFFEFRTKYIAKVYICLLVEEGQSKLSPYKDHDFEQDIK